MSEIAAPSSCSDRVIRAGRSGKSPRAAASSVSSRRLGFHGCPRYRSGMEAVSKSGVAKRRLNDRVGPGGARTRGHPCPGGDRATRRLTSCLYGGTEPPAFGPSGVSVSSHRMRVRKASQRLVTLRACHTEETNQRFRQSKVNVPSSNQWIITQPTSRPFSPLAVECEAAMTACCPSDIASTERSLSAGPPRLGSARCRCHRFIY